MKTRLLHTAKLVMAAFLILAATAPAPSEEGAAQGKDSGEGVPILAMQSYWRTYVALRPLLFGTSAFPRTHTEAFGEYPIREKHQRQHPGNPDKFPCSAFPPAEWTRPEFDDRDWWRDPGPYFGGGAYRGDQYWFPSPHQDRYGELQPINTALLCLRGRFEVTDLSKVKNLKLSAEYRGGMVVYLNGEEVGRSHMPEGPITFDTLAEDYPKEVTAGPELPRIPADLSREEREKLKAQAREMEMKARELRIRSVKGMELPVSALRKGLNVLALEIHRAIAYNEKLPRDSQIFAGTRHWNTVGLLDVDVRACGEGIQPNVARPKGLQVWNANVLKGIFPEDYGDPDEPLRPIRIEGARNGTFSGLVVVGNDEGLKGVSASVSELAHESKKTAIPGKCLPVRYACPWTNQAVPRTPGRPPNQTERKRQPGIRWVWESRGLRFDALSDPTDDTFKQYRPEHFYLNIREPQPRKTQPVWVTVRVPKDAPAGMYAGKLNVRVGDALAATVPVELRVHDFVLPDPTEYRTWVDFVQSPESLSSAYGVPLWSKRHFELIGKSFSLIAGIGGKLLYIPLIARTYLGNTETMVRWVKKPDGSWAHDFRPMERYLDTALKQGMKPRMVVLQVWDVHVGFDPRQQHGVGGGGKNSPEEKNVPITVLDARTGEIELSGGPKYSDPEARAFWQPVIDGIRERLRKRGLDGTITLGLVSDRVPTKEICQFWRELCPEAGWMMTTHYGVDKLYNEFPVSCRNTILGWRGASEPTLLRCYGWEREPVVVLHTRYQRVPPTAWGRLIFERPLQGGLRGCGFLPGDFMHWGYRGFYGRFIESSWTNLGMVHTWIPLGEKGPVSSTLFEMAREGIQECEARIFLERVLTDKKLRGRLDEGFAKKCQEILDERTRMIAWSDSSAQNARRYCHLPGGCLGYDWYAGSGWQARSAALYEAAARVQKVVNMGM